MGAAGSVPTPEGDAPPMAPDGATLKAAIDALTAAPPPTSGTDTRLALAALRRLGNQPLALQPKQQQQKKKKKRWRPAPLHAEAAPPKLADALVDETPSLSMVGVDDFTRRLAPPPASLRIEPRGGVLPPDAARAVWADALGLYKLVDGLAIGSRPVWRHASARDRWRCGPMCPIRGVAVSIQFSMQVHRMFLAVDR